MREGPGSVKDAKRKALEALVVTEYPNHSALLGKKEHSRTLDVKVFRVTAHFPLLWHQTTKTHPKTTPDKATNPETQSPTIRIKSPNRSLRT